MYGLIHKINLKFVQLHGTEDEAYIKKIKKFGVKIIKTISIANTNDLDKINSFKSADYILFDYLRIT